jgi:4-diphosphocytidyl-2-C-methyl-D-erythritol kinase
MTVITELAPAKINLTLEVLGKRGDGYHELQSLVAFAQDAADVVTLDPSRPAGCHVTGPFGATISGKNLIDVTLAKLAATDAGLKLGHVTLEKNLPVAAGIGGGSADGAAVLRAVRRANPGHKTSVDWLAIAAFLGADVPVCFINCSSWMTGVGEAVTPIAMMPGLTAVLINPLHPMPEDKTARVFRSLSAQALPASRTAEPAPELPDLQGLMRFMVSRGNSLQSAALTVAPVIAEVLKALRLSSGCLYAAVSGGGPTCFGIFSSATAAATELLRTHPQWWVRATRLS